MFKPAPDSKGIRLIPLVLPLLLSACSNNNPTGSAPLSQNSPLRDRPFNDHWQFTKGDPAGAEIPDFSNAAWRTLNLPHDYSIEGPFDSQWASATAYLPAGIAWYRKTFDTPLTPLTPLTTPATPATLTTPATPLTTQEQILSLHFDGIYKNSSVYLNGHLLGTRPNGYVPLDYDLTPYLNPPGHSNLLAVRVDHSDFADSRWYPGSGIFRNVSLITTSRIHVAHDGTFITSNLASKEKPFLSVETTISDDHPAMGTAHTTQVDLKTTIYDQQGHTFTSALASKVKVISGDTLIAQKIPLPSGFSLWSPDHPTLYTAVTEIIQEGRTMDSYHTPFGIRDIKYDANTGLALNGQPTKLKGVCLHEDAGALGSAIPIEVWERRLQLLKDAGCNAIRTSHNPPAAEFLDLCDKMGFLVMDESFDEWTTGKKKWVDGWNATKFTTDGYHTAFNEWADRDVEALVLRDRNHPSIIMWSVGNEIDYPNDPYPPNDPTLLAIAQRLVKDVHALDTTRPVTAACAAIKTNLFYPALDVVGYNYQEQSYAEDHAAHPDRIIFGSENKHDLNAWLAVENNPYIAGQFLWTGIDYLGEARAWPARSSTAGLLDLAAFPKPTYYFRQSLWSDKPMVYLSPVRTGVRIYTNCPTVELFQAGKSLGEKPLPPERVLNWPVDTTAGELRLVGKKDGKAVAEFQWINPGNPAKLTLKEIPTHFGAGSGPHVAQFEIRITDANGHRVANATQDVTVAIAGQATLLALDTGSNTSHEDYHANHRLAFEGRLIAYIESHGPFTLTATAPSLEPARAALDH